MLINPLIIEKLRNILLMVALVLLPITSLAKDVALIYDKNSGYQTSFVDILSQRLAFNADVNLTSFATSSLSIPELLKNQPDLIVNLDNKTGEKLMAAAKVRKIATFHALTTLARSRSFAPCLPRCTRSLPKHRFFVLDQPAERQINLIQLINPTFKSIGVILTEQSKTQLKPLKEIAKRKLLSINEYITTSKNVRYQINDVSKSSDVILAIADTNIYNTASLSQILLTSYRYRTPIIGFSKGFIKAGAIAGTVSSLDQLAQHLSESVLNLDNVSQSSVSNIIYPKHFDVMSNRNVAKSLNLHFPTDHELKNQLMAYEPAR